MERKYRCNSWTDATKQFAQILSKLPADKPVALLPIVRDMLGDKHEWAKDILKQFEHLGFITLNSKDKKFIENDFIILHNSLNEFGIY